MFGLELAQTISTAYPQIATESSGVSWGALIAILGAIPTIGVGALGIFYNMLRNVGGELKTTIEKQNIQFTAMFERVNDKIEKVEVDSRSSRKDLFDSQMKLKDQHADRLTKIETTIKLMSMKTPIAGNPPIGN